MVGVGSARKWAQRFDSTHQIGAVQTADLEPTSADYHKELGR
jgi:hypothetical protein